MLEFKKPQFSDKQKVKDCFRQTSVTDCEYTFGNIMIWQDVYKTEICFYKGFFVSRTTDENGNYSFCFPKGKGNYDEIISIIEDSYKDVSFFGLNSEDVEILKKVRENSYEIFSERDMFDYIYRVSDLANLKGKKYHQKRNHISFFEKNYDWSYEEINDKNIDECLKMNEEWEKLNSDKAHTGTALEEKAIKTAFKYFERLNFVGGLVKIQDKVVAYTFGEEINGRTFCTHVEKALSDYRGAYAIINREFAKNTISEYEFVNREEDMGIEGLRKSKLSYHPYMISEIFNAEKR